MGTRHQADLVSVGGSRGAGQHAEGGAGDDDAERDTQRRSLLVVLGFDVSIALTGTVAPRAASVEIVWRSPAGRIAALA